MFPSLRLGLPSLCWLEALRSLPRSQRKGIHKGTLSSVMSFSDEPHTGTSLDTYFIERGVASEKRWLRFPPAWILHAMAGWSPAVQVKAPRPRGVEGQAQGHVAGT